MTLYIILYDLLDETDNRDYTKITDALEDNGFVRLQGSVWIGRHQEESEFVHNFFKDFMDSTDSLIVTELSDNRFMSNVRTDSN